jgi:Rieske Fe-S protein
MNKNEITRRRFLRRAWRFGIGASAATAAAAIVAYFFPRDLRDTPAEPVRAGTLEALRARGYIELVYGVYPAIVVLTEAGPAAFSRVCTHFSCTVTYDTDTHSFRCPCHDGTFDGTDGSVTGGPPDAPLRRFEVYVEGGEVYVGSPGGEG